MDGLSFSAWVVLILGFVICFGGAFYCLLLMWGKQPERMLEWLGLADILSNTSDTVVDAGIYKPFEYMEQGPKEKGVGMAVLLVLLLIGWGLGVFEAESEGGYSDVDYKVELYDGALDPLTGYSNEDTTVYRAVDVEEAAITNITFTLTWQDEPDQPAMENDGDEFSLNVTTPWGEGDETPMTRNEHGEEGVLILTFRAPAAGEYPDSGSAGTYHVNITMGEAGEQWLLGIPSVGLNDGGNDWTLTVEYQYYRRPL